jgi:hypothetical protein
VPYSSRTLPEPHTGRWTALAVAASAAPWVTAQCWVWFGARSALDSDVVLVLVGATALVAWSSLTWLKTPRPPFGQALKIVGAGLGATAIWVPSLFLTAGLVPLAIHALAAGFIPLALIPLVVWGSFCGAWVLSRYAVTALLSDE